MLVAAGMDAQQMEAKLLEAVEKAEAAWLEEKDENLASRREKIYMRAKDELERFRGQQVAGGEDPPRAARSDLHGVRQQGLWEALSRALPPGLAEAPKLGHARALALPPPHQGGSIELQGEQSFQSAFFAVNKKRAAAPLVRPAASLADAELVAMTCFCGDYSGTCLTCCAAAGDMPQLRPCSGSCHPGW